MTSQTLSWHLEKTLNFSENSHVMEMNAHLKEQRRKPEIGWQNSQDEVPLDVLTGLDDQLNAGPIRPFEASDNAGLREIAKSSSAKLTPSQPLRLSDEGLARYDDIPRRSTTPFSVESRPVHSGTMDDSAAHNTPSHVGQLGVEDIEELSEHRPDTPVGIACALPERPEPSVCKTDGAAVAYRVKRHLSADFVPSSQEGEEDSSPSSALRPAPAYKRIDVDCEIVPASQNTSTIASSSTSIPVKPKKDKQPAPLGLTHTYTIKRGRPKALLTCTASRVQQRPTYP